MEGNQKVGKPKALAWFCFSGDFLWFLVGF